MSKSARKSIRLPFALASESVNTAVLTCPVQSMRNPEAAAATKAIRHNLAFAPLLHFRCVPLVCENKRGLSNLSLGCNLDNLPDAPDSWKCSGKYESFKDLMGTIVCAA